MIAPRDAMSKGGLDVDYAVRRDDLLEVRAGLETIQQSNVRRRNLKEELNRLHEQGFV